jgi:hypothetical protein
MPKIIEQPADLGDVPPLHGEKPARKKLKMGVNKWARERDQIEHVLIGNRRFYTDRAMNAYLRKKTVKPRGGQAAP